MGNERKGNKTKIEKEEKAKMEDKENEKENGEMKRCEEKEIIFTDYS